MHHIEILDFFININRLNIIIYNLNDFYNYNNTRFGNNWINKAPKTMWICKIVRASCPVTSESCWANVHCSNPHEVSWLVSRLGGINESPSYYCRQKIRNRILLPYLHVRVWSVCWLPRWLRLNPTDPNEKTKPKILINYLSTSLSHYLILPLLLIFCFCSHFIQFIGKSSRFFFNFITWQSS